MSTEARGVDICVDKYHTLFCVRRKILKQQNETTFLEVFRSTDLLVLFLFHHILSELAQSFSTV